MPYYFTCPYCLNKTLVSEQIAGQRGACVGCGKDVVVPPPPSRSQANIAPAEDQGAPKIIEVRKRRFSPRAVKTTIFAVAALPVLIFGFWLLSPTILQLKVRRDVAACKQNLQRIAKALNAYAAEYGTYPPPAVLDSNGTPMHSWRVLILPYLGEKRLYKRYDMTKPWNATENANIQAQIPSVFVCPANSNATMVGESNYMLITGARTLFPPTGPAKPSAIADGKGNTLLVVETANSTIAWTDPRDLNIATMPPTIGAVGGIGGNHQGGATVVFADGQPGWLPSDINKPVLDGLLSPSGGESVFGSWFRK